MPRLRLVPLAALASLIVGLSLLVLGLAPGRGEAFDAAASHLTGEAGPTLDVPGTGIHVALSAGTVSPAGTVDPPRGVAMWLEGFTRVSPGAVGTSVIAGHLVHSGEDDVFAELPDVRPGQEVHLVAGTERLRFRVTETVVVDKVELTGSDVVWGSNTSSRRLVLITCDDSLGFRADGHRAANYVVVAEAV